ncbi:MULTISPECIES: iron-containing alcohol dehydrogenase [unclassified Burkholderia]|uniref:iron-containing alcohol dehydrogenase n=1 Tax=unclassified Burkholderia TaxID=2613784 RepID=UPI000F56D472|nr:MULTISPECIES: iron-containing alcohol dehydrogenase [unclassified Burkholderia]RQS26832.1 iron-containing alcohol dehydrogenase [Burkholderia sp. Bp8995]RQS51718.1 iron-containing alcohol dehydrogenase [Burkholderia sp. Bp8989]
MSLSFETTPRIVCEQGSAQRLHEIVAAVGGSRVLMVTDKGMQATGLLEPVIVAFAKAGQEAIVYADVQADPPEEVVLAAVEFAIQHKIDAVVGIGGGSSMDTAKLVALLAKTKQPLAEIYGIGLAKGPRLPLIQVPTTAGTGSEATPISIVTTPTHEKKGVVSSLLYPDVAVLDGLLTLGLPPAVTAMTGIDAMVHAIEAYTSRHKKNLLSDMFALRALTLLYPNIRRAVSDGADAQAREQMLLGSLLAGIAFANAPVAAVHALAYPLGGHYGLPHGLTNSLMLVPVMRFNERVAAPLYAELGRVMLPELGPLPEAAASEAFVDAIATLVREMPYAQTLREAGISASSLPMLATDAMNVKRLLINNPRDVEYEDALALYQEAF